MTKRVLQTAPNVIIISVTNVGSAVTERVLYQRLVTRLQAELDLSAAPALDVETLAPQITGRLMAALISERKT